MTASGQPGLIERIAEKLHLIARLEPGVEEQLDRLAPPGRLQDYPPPEQWDDWVPERSNPRSKNRGFDCSGTLSTALLDGDRIGGEPDSSLFAVVGRRTCPGGGGDSHSDWFVPGSGHLDSSSAAHSLELRF